MALDTITRITPDRCALSDVPLLHSIGNLYAPTRRYTGDRVKHLLVGDRGRIGHEPSCVVGMGCVWVVSVNSAISSQV